MRTWDIVFPTLIRPPPGFISSLPKCTCCFLKRATTIIHRSQRPAVRFLFKWRTSANNIRMYVFNDRELPKMTILGRTWNIEQTINNEPIHPRRYTCEDINVGDKILYYTNTGCGKWSVVTNYTKTWCWAADLMALCQTSNGNLTGLYNQLNLGFSLSLQTWGLGGSETHNTFGRCKMVLVHFPLTGVAQPRWNSWAKQRDLPKPSSC